MGWAGHALLFNTADGRRVRDGAGQELPDHEAAQRYAVIIARRSSRTIRS
ncbi:DUF6894 family protein [Allosphingosinicella deserti]